MAQQTTGAPIKVLDKAYYGNWYFPSHDINPKDKGREWCRQWAQAIYGSYMKANTGLYYSQRAQFEVFRAYGMGRQSPDKYKSQLGIVDTSLHPYDAQRTNTGINEILRKQYDNLNWDNVSVIPKFKAAVINRFMEVQQDLTCTAIDTTSINNKQETKWKTWLDAVMKEEMGKINVEMAENMFGGEEKPINPKSIQELELYDMIGGFKSKLEEAFEVLLRDAFHTSNWEDIKYKILDDLFDLGVGCTKDYIDPVSKKIKTRYVDPINAIAQYTRNFNFEDSDYFAEFRNYALADVMREADITQEELLRLAPIYNTYLSNPLLALTSNYTASQAASDNNLIYNNYKLSVLDCEWHTINTEYKVVKTNRFGDKRIYEQDWGKEVNTEQKKTKKVSYKTIYKCKWVVGTNIVWDFGVQDDIPRNENNEPKPSFHFYKLPGKSFTESIIPNTDQIQLAILRIQHEIAKKPGSGIMFEYDSISNLSLGGSTMTPADVIKLYSTTGNLIYKQTLLSNGMPNAANPIQELRGGVGAYLTECFGIIDKNMEMIRTVTGINEIMDSSSPKTTMAVGVSQLALASGNTVVSKLYFAYLQIKESCANNMCRRAQIGLRFYPQAYESYLISIGWTRSNIIALSEDVAFAKMLIKIEEKPTEEQKGIIRNAAIEAMRAGKNGSPGIDMADYLMIERYLNSGNMKYAEALLAQKIKQNDEKQQALQQQNMQMNGQNAIQLEQQKQQGEAANIQMETQSKIAVLQTTYQLKMELLKLDYQLKAGHNVVETQNRIAENSLQQEQAPQNGTSAGQPPMDFPLQQQEQPTTEQPIEQLEQPQENIQPLQ